MISNFHNYLEEILLKKQDEIKKLKNLGINYFQEKINQNLFSSRSFYDSISSTKTISLIAELKKASPSKGIIRKNFNYIEIANSLIKAGASAFSILTEQNYFLGKPEYLSEIKKKFNISILRKDFIFDPIQIFESKAIGADAILLIKALLSNMQLQELILIAKSLNLDILVEIHTLDELNDISKLNNINIIGINNRNLKTFKVDIEIANKILPNIKSTIKNNCLTIAESGYKSHNEIENLNKLGFNAVLIGEGLALNNNLFLRNKK